MKRSLGVVGAVLSLTAVLAGCGNDDGSGSTDRPGSSSDPVNVHLITSVGVSLFDNPQFVAAAKAAAAAINDDGGVGASGQHVEITFCNDKSDPNEGLACARKAVEDEAHVVIGVSITGDSFLPVLESAKLAYVNWPTVGADFNSPASFPIVGGDASSLTGISVLAKKKGASRAAFGMSECGPCDPKLQAMVDTAERIGLDVAGTLRWPYTTADFAPTVQKIQDLDADAFAFAAGSVDGAGLAKATGEGKLGIPTFTSASHMYNVMNEEGGTLPADFDGEQVVFQLPPASADIPALDHWKDGIAGYEAETGETVGLSDMSEGAWAMVYAVGAVIDEVDGEVNAESVTAALQSAEDLDVAGILTWSPGAKGPSEYPRVTNWSVWFGVVDNGDFVVDSVEPVDIRELGGLD